MRLLLFFTVFVCKGIFAQPINLVPNPGFEYFSSCPYYEPSPYYSGANAICLASPWFQPLEPNVPFSDFNCGESSSDFYHTCAGRIPKMMFDEGYQFPNSGNGFTGIAMFNPIFPNESREYIEIAFLYPLTQKNIVFSGLPTLQISLVLALIE